MKQKQHLVILILLLSTILFASADSEITSNMFKRDTTYSAYNTPVGGAYTSTSASVNNYPISYGYNYLYAAPFICGTVPAGDMRYGPGIYATSIDILALIDTRSTIQLSFNAPPVTQFEPGVVTNSKQITLNRRATFTLDCEELLNPANFDRGTATTTAPFFSGYAIIESVENVVIYDFISVNSGTTNTTDIEVIAINALRFNNPSYSSGSSYGNGYGQGQGSYGSNGYQDGGQGAGSNNPYGQGAGANYGQGQGNYPPFGQGQGQGNYPPFGGQGQYRGFR